jgi:Spy/CpxP family protein refolding chaperone
MVTFDARAGKWLALALLVSLAGNAFMGGLLFGRWANPESPATPVVTVSEPATQTTDSGMPAAEAPAGLQVRRMAATLPPQYRPIFFEPFQQRRREILTANLALRDARLRLRDALLAENVDRSRLDTAFVELRQRNTALQALMHTAATDGMLRLPPEQRRQLADWQRVERQQLPRRGTFGDGPRPDRPLGPGGRP